MSKPSRVDSASNTGGSGAASMSGVVRGNVALRGRVQRLARQAELNQRSALAARMQQDKMDVARDAGQMTNLEWKRQNTILMARRKRAGI